MRHRADRRRRRLTLGAYADADCARTSCDIDRGVGPRRLRCRQQAADIGQIKVAKGEVTIERGGQMPRCRRAGARLQSARRRSRPGADGSVGLTMSDNFAALCGSEQHPVVSIATRFDSTTEPGQFDATLQKGSLAVISGRIAKQSPEAMKVRTPSAILGVRGTEFVVSANDD